MPDMAFPPEAGVILLARSSAVPGEAEFAVKATDDSLSPHVKRGENIFFSREPDLSPGDVGLFMTDGGLVCRQYARDSYGFVYLFTLNRTLSALDRTYPPASPPTCLGRVLLPAPVPLPGTEE